MGHDCTFPSFHIYLDVLQGKLDQKEEQLEVSYTMGRDLEPGKVEELLDSLKAW